MMIAKGVVLGPYEILAQIGAGGMGDVWCAWDRRIRREVAIKVLPDAYAPGDDRIRRFEQEARAAGALNHPGLVTIFDVGTVDGSPYIVMELLEGETLREALGDDTPTPLPLRKTIDYAIQLASALAVAHEKGIIHRDLKPENIFITAEGRVKILDFGLAKLAEDATVKDGRNKTARHLTSSGMVVGTPGYMSPEQVSTKPLDYRTDIFSLGAVLYEMISGRRAFERDSAVETMMAVMSEDPPPLDTIRSKVPTILESIVHHCMEKNPRERFQSARDLAFDLKMLPEFQNSQTDSLKPVPAARKWPYRTTITACAVLALAGAGFTFLRLRSVGPSAILRTYKQLTFGDGVAMFPTLSPDGKLFAYVASQAGNRDIYVQRVDGRVATNITSDSPDDDSEPAFSPDGSQIAFRSERDGGGIFIMFPTGESVRRLTTFGHHPSWSPDGTHIVVSTIAVGLRPHVRPSGGYGELWILDARTGASRPLVQARVGGPDFGSRSDAVQPSWSPHGKRIAFWGLSTEAGQRDIWTIDPNAPRPKETVVRVTSDPALHWNPVWSADGKYLYFGSNADGTLNLWRIPMDEASGTPNGAAEPLSLPASVSGNFSFSPAGGMVFTSVTRSYRLLALPFDATSGRAGTPRTLFAGSQEILSFEPSPDEQSIALAMGGVQEDLFIANADGSRIRQLTNDEARDRDVTWSSDGKTLFFTSNRDGAYRVWSIRADGSALTRVSDDADFRPLGVRNLFRPRVSPDGHTLIVSSDRGSRELLHLDRPPAQRAEVMRDNLALDRWSPNGQLIVGATESGGIDVYSPQTRRSENVFPRGRWPAWLPDGGRIIFFEQNRIDILDLVSHRATSARLPSLPQVQFDSTTFLSRDGTTLWVRQTLEQGDIWLANFKKQ